MTDQSPSVETEQAQDAQEPTTFDAEYVKQLREEAKARRLQAESFKAKLDELTAAQQAAEQAQLEEQNEFKTLYETTKAEAEELRTYKAQVQKMKESAEAANTAFIETVPEAMRSLIPTNYEPLDLQNWLQSNRELLIGQKFTPPPTNGAAGFNNRPNGQHKPLTSSELEIAEKMGITPEAYQEAKAKIKRK